MTGSKKPFSTIPWSSRSPVSPTLRQRFNQLAQHPETLPIIWEENTRFLQQRSSSLIPTVVSIDTTQKTDDMSLLPLDVDHSPFDNSGTKKEGVRFMYKKVEGYNPAFAYLGEERHLVYAQLHEGNEHVQKNMPEVLQQALASAGQITSEQLCVRMDGGNDAKENLKLCDDHGADFIIKRNPRRESPEAWLAHAEQRGTASPPAKERPFIPAVFRSASGLSSLPMVQHAREQRLSLFRGHPWKDCFIRLFHRYTPA
ncbi:transposase [Salibacterium lacus]|uniref:Transposase n=1 Tax=Salibacterium lacus TaxID=1898109 RepID=A0ABW5T088_9BACI